MFKIVPFAVIYFPFLNCTCILLYYRLQIPVYTAVKYDSFVAVCFYMVNFTSCIYVFSKQRNCYNIPNILQIIHYTFFFFFQPLPEKFIMKGMVERFSDEFIETRRKALHKFLNRIADHPTLTFNEDFKIFLTAQAWVKWLYFYLQLYETMSCVSRVYQESPQFSIQQHPPTACYRSVRRRCGIYGIFVPRDNLFFCAFGNLACGHKYCCTCQSSFCCCVLDFCGTVFQLCMLSIIHISFKDYMKSSNLNELQFWHSTCLFHLIYFFFLSYTGLIKEKYILCISCGIFARCCHLKIRLLYSESLPLNFSKGYSINM